MLEFDTVKAWLGKRVVGSDGESIGKFDEVYLDRGSGQPEWAAIRTGMFGSKMSFAPIDGAGTDGDDVRLAYTKAAVKDAPNVEADGELSTEEEQRLFEHYGRADYSDWDQRSDATESSLGRDDHAGRDDVTGVAPIAVPDRGDGDGDQGDGDRDETGARSLGGDERARGADVRSDRSADDRGESERTRERTDRHEVHGLGDLPIQPRRARLRRYIVTEEVIIDERGHEDAHVVDRELLDDEKKA